jgi:hypothetical protein
MSDPIYFGCGEIVPGTEPITVPNLPTPVPTVLVPNPKEVLPEVPPFIPPTGGTAKFKCVTTTEVSRAPSPGPGLQYVEPNIFRYCLPCNGIKNTTGFSDPSYNPNPTDPECVWLTQPECDLNCPNPTEPKPASTFQQAPAAGPQPGLGLSRPVTGILPHKCRQTFVICSQDISSPNPRILTVDHKCVPCGNSPFQAGGSNALVSTGSPILKGSTATQINESACVYSSKSECDISCPPGGVTGNFVLNCQEPLQQASLPVSNGDPLNISVINVQETGNQEPTVSNNPIGTNSQIFHNKYNLFSINTSQNPITITSQNLYPNIFKPEVISNVGYLITNQGSQSSWTEDMLFSVTLEKIEESLQPSLLGAFESIHNPGGTLVGKNNFLKMIKKHLLEGTLDEIDVDHYITLEARQAADQRVAFRGTQDRDLSERVALGLVSVGGVPADTSKLARQQQLQGRRERRLLTDINAKIVADVASGTTDLDLLLSDTGFTVKSLAGASSQIFLGDGDGYYVPSKLSNGNEIPLLLKTDIENTFYVPPGVRENALKLANQDTAYTLSAQAILGQNEFAVDDPGPSSLVPLYLKLDLSSFYFGTNTNPLFSTYGAIYNVENDQDEIDTHSKNNGMAVTRINLDYRDPLYRYILDSRKASLSLNDINFSTIIDPKDFPNGVRIARNIPFGLVITPVAGSKFNPFNGRSTVIEHAEPYGRLLRLNPDIDVSDENAPKPQLEEAVLFYETGDVKVGLVEPSDNQNIVYKYQASSSLYTETFYADGVYTTSADITPVSTPGESYIIREVIDYIVTTYNPEKVTWYDVIRRMPLNKVGEFLYSTTPALVNRLERGLRSGLKIDSVFNTDRDLDDLLLIDDDKTIIKESDR